MEADKRKLDKNMFSSSNYFCDKCEMPIPYNSGKLH